MLFDKVITKMSEDQLPTISSLIGKNIRAQVKSDASKLKSKYKRIKELSGYDDCQSKSSSNPTLVSFLKATCGIDSLVHKRQTYQLALVIEGVEKLCYPNIVYPFAFLNNFHNYAETGSRSTVIMNRIGAGGGQYDTISNWLSNLSSSPAEPPKGDVDHAFDNNKKIGKTWHVSVNNKVKASVIATHIWLSIVLGVYKRTRSLSLSNGTTINP